MTKRTEVISARDTLFLHYLDRYHFHIALTLHRYEWRSVVREALLATKYALLLAEKTYVSASVYFENPVARDIISTLSAFSSAGFLRLVSKYESMQDHFEVKAHHHYGFDSPESLQEAYKHFRDTGVPYERQDVFMGQKIREIWLAEPDVGRELEAEQGTIGTSTYAEFERAWMQVPERIGERAIVLPHVKDAIEKSRVALPSDLFLLRRLDAGYVESHTGPLKAGLMRDLLFLRTPWAPESEPASDISFQEVHRKLIGLGLQSVIEGADGETLLRIKLSAAWRALMGDLSMRSREAVAKIVDESKPSIELAKVRSESQRFADGGTVIGIVTALPEEWLAVCSAFEAESIDSPPHDPNEYAMARLGRDLPQSGYDVKAIMTFLPRTGNNSSAVSVSNLLRSFPAVSEVVFCGIACACPDVSAPVNHVRLGDIVISDGRGVIQLDHEAVVEGSSRNRSALPPPSRKLLNVVRRLAAEELGGTYRYRYHLERITANRGFRKPRSRLDVLLDEQGAKQKHPRAFRPEGGFPRLFYGNIGSSNRLLRDWRIREDLSKRFNLRAIEMEGAGTAEAVWQFAKSYLVVRGTCDYGDDRTKGDEWHMYAAAVAAAYVRSIAECLPTETK